MLKRTFSLILVLFVAQWARAAEKLIGGPYVVNVGHRTATVVWIPETPGAASELRPQKITLSGLEPGKTYSYDVLGGEAGKGSFKTAPTGAAKFRFVVYGDTRTRHEMHQRVIEAISKAEPDFVLHTGDLVSDGRDTAQWPVFFSIERELLRKTVFFPSLGNHERNNPQYYEFFDVRTPYYSFNWGACHFVVLNSDFGNAAKSAEEKEAFWAEQRRWLEDDLRKSKRAALRFLVFHHPPFTAVKRRQGGKHPVQALVPLLEQYKVTAVFNGHDHNYQHHLKGGVHYITTGGGGAPLYDVDAPIAGITQKVDKSEHFVEVNVDGRRARVEAHALDGRLIDTIELTP